jgi:CCR4-NOT transcriptional regulation complex NOT5 subunit
MKNASDSVLLYIFYNLTLEKQQVEAASMLKRRGWLYNAQQVSWYRKDSRSPTGWVKFDPQLWETVVGSLGS